MRPWVPTMWVSMGFGSKKGCVLDSFRSVVKRRNLQRTKAKLGNELESFGKQKMGR